MNGNLVSVVLSFRNEEETIPVLIDRLTAAFARTDVDYELIFVNDASTDRSVEVLLACRKTDERIKILNMARRFGVAECVLAGMAVASGDAVIYMDADLQDPPEVIPVLLEQWRAGADVVHTVRTRRHGEHFIKRFVTYLAYRVVQVGSTIDLPPDAGDFKLLTRPVVDHLLALRETDPYLRGLVVWLGFKQVFVPYEREARHGGATHFPLFSRNPRKTLALGVTSFSFAPIYACGMMGLIGTCAGISLIAVAITGWARDARYASSATLLALGLLMWGTIMVGIAIVGVYVARTYKDVRGRPQYIVKSAVGLSVPSAIEEHSRQNVTWP